MNEKTEKKRLAILRLIRDAGKPIGSSTIAQRLESMGYEVTERTVRWYLKGLDDTGMTQNLGRRGRRITEVGMQELQAARIIDKVGVLAARIDEMTYGMDFSLSTKAGSVVVNVSVIPRKHLERSIELMSQVFAAGYAMGTLLTVYRPRENAGEVYVPDDSIGFGTVCSVTVNGVLLAHGVPTHSRFGGLLELQDKRPTRFVELIHYDGTTLDPLEVFIRSGMTDYTGAIGSGTGRIGASFREIPAGSRDRVIDLAAQLEEVGLGGFMSIGWPGHPLFEIPVSEGRAGAVVIGGLNPAAILEEQGIRAESRALATLVEYERLFPYGELAARTSDLM